MSNPVFILRLRAEGNGPEPVMRLKRLLKIALRTCGLRCVDIAATPRQNAQDARSEAGSTGKPSEGMERDSSDGNGHWLAGGGDGG